jgi:hypothetical protein
MTTANIRELAEFELIKTLDAMDKNDAPLDSAIEYVHPYTESGQRAGYWSIKLSDKVTLRAYCSGDLDGFNVREIDFVYTSDADERHVLDLDHIWRTGARGYQYAYQLTGFNTMYAMVADLISKN